MQQEPFTLPDEVTVISIITDGVETATIAVPPHPPRHHLRLRRQRLGHRRPHHRPRLARRRLPHQPHQLPQHPERSMTTTPDTIDALTADLTEDDAWKILFAMARKFHWIPCVWSMGDVLVSDDEDPDDEYCASDLAEPLTEAERSTVAATWEWRKGINDYASQQVADMEMIPHVVRHYRDGEQVGFTVRTGYDGAVRYDMDGNEDMDGHEDEDED